MSSGSRERILHPLRDSAEELTLLKNLDPYNQLSKRGLYT